MRILLTISLLFTLTSCIDYAIKGAKRYNEETGGADGVVKLVGDNVVKAEKISRWTYAANGGDAEAQYELGKAFCCGKRPYYNTYDALKWFCRAAKQGQRDAMYEIAKIYDNYYKEEGSIIPRDEIIAYVYYIKSVEHGNDAAKWPRDRKMNKLSADQRQKAQSMLNKWPDVQCEIH